MEMSDEERVSKVQYLVSTGHCISMSQARMIVARERFDKVTKKDFGRRPTKKKLIEIEN